MGDLMNTLSGMTLNDQPEDPLTANMNALTSFGKMQVKSNADTPIEVTTTNKDGGRVDVSMSHEQYASIQAALKDYEGIRASFNEEINKAKLQEAAIRRNPLANIAANIAGGLAANDPTLPGWVRAAGKTAMALNPTADALQQKRLGLMEALSQIDTKQAQMMGTLHGAQNEQRRLSQEDQRIAISQANEKRLAEKDATSEADKKADNIRQLNSDYQQMAATSGAFSEELYLNDAKAKGVPEATAKTTAAALKKYAADVTARMQAQEAQKSKLEQQRADHAMDRMITQQGQIMDRQERNAAKEAVKGYMATPDERTALAKLPKVAENIDRLEAAVKSSPILSGKFAGMIPDKLKQLDDDTRRLMQASTMSMLDMLAAGGDKLSRSTEQDVQKLKENIAQPDMSPKLALETIENMRRLLKKVPEAIITARPLSDWTGRDKGLIPEKYRKDMDGVVSAAREGFDPDLIKNLGFGAGVAAIRYVGKSQKAEPEKPKTTKGVQSFTSKSGVTFTVE